MALTNGSHGSLQSSLASSRSRAPWRCRRLSYFVKCAANFLRFVKIEKSVCTPFLALIMTGRRAGPKGKLKQKLEE